MSEISELNELDYETILDAATKKARKWARNYVCQDINVRHGIDWWVMQETAEYLRAQPSKKGVVE